MESWFSNVFFACCASWFKKKMFSGANFSPSTATQNWHVSGYFWNLWRTIRGRFRDRKWQCVESVVKKLKYGVLFCHRLPKCFCTKHCTVYFGSRSLFLVWYVTDSWNICWHSKSVPWCFRPKFSILRHSRIF